MEREEVDSRKFVEPEQGSGEREEEEEEGEKKLEERREGKSREKRVERESPLDLSCDRSNMYRRGFF